MDKVMIILRGLPEAGKTTIANFLEHNLYCTSEIVSADDYWYDENCEYKFNPTKLGEAHKWAQIEATTWCRFGTRCVIIANTNTTMKEIQPYYDIAEKYGYTVFSMIVENRHGNKNDHNVPEETVSKMKQRFEIKL